MADEKDEADDGLEAEQDPASCPQCGARLQRLPAVAGPRTVACVRCSYQASLVGGVAF